ncbi:class I histocompatibility antigen, F10 alpha chain isoform X1 [Anolis carolinensis]|uniref:class I histocompatibility antigen, F10 alpha chain isoform X1 n=1 Tax=Anolis carolinensis TaxID=28377 RepID=UPI002F2B8185
MAPMGQLWGLLGVAVPLLMEVGLGGAPSHSLSYLFTVVSEPGPGLPQFMVSGHFDGQLFASYDSERRSGVPRTEWMEEMVELDPGYWDWLNRNARNSEQIFKWQIGTVMRHYNHSGGLHTMQWVFSCTLSEDGRKGGSNKFSYDGKEALSFDKETLRWTASDAVAEGYKEKWEAEAGRTQRSKVYLEDKCISMLHKHLDVRKGVPRKRVAPVVKVTHKAGIGGLETLVCHIHGFYPKDIDATWRKDEEVREQETLRGNITPNSDGTYNTWISIEVDEKDRDKYQCHVEHDSLPEGAGSDLDFPVVECGAPILPWIIVGSALVLILIVTLIVIILKKRGSQNAPATNAEMQEMNPPQRRRRICISVAE